MIPLKDTIPSRTVPFITYLLIAVNTAVFLLEFMLGPRVATDLVYRFGLVPASFLSCLRGAHLHWGGLLPLVTSMFIHGGWLHLIGNMLFLYIFGDNVEDSFGHLRYLVFYILSGLAAAGTQIAVNGASQDPMVGANGAIAGVLGAYVFMFPRARVVTLIPIFFFFQVMELPAFLFLGVWFLLQAVSGMLSLGIGSDAGGVASWAHIGGFSSGVATMPFFRRRSALA